MTSQEWSLRACPTFDHWVGDHLIRMGPIKIIQGAADPLPDRLNLCIDVACYIILRHVS